jgi:ubiquinone/menaquinone biosynthesis C-methylase UbiE
MNNFLRFNIAELHAAIDVIDKVGDVNLRKALTPRKLKELEYHDRDRDLSRIEQTKATDTYDRFYGNKKYYSATKRSKVYVDQWISRESSEGGIFLDYACGNGGNALKAARLGADLALGLDISSVSIANAKQAAKDSGLDNVRFFQADAENTLLPDNSVDKIICSGMLHHLDLSFALPELRRILRPGGKILAVEALDYNPLIKLYRMLTPDMRTEWEKAHILSLKDISFAKRFFNLGEIRYWHVIGYAGGKFPTLSVPLDFFDRLLEKIPYVQRMSWIFTFELLKSVESVGE